MYTNPRTIVSQDCIRCSEKVEPNSYILNVCNLCYARKLLHLPLSELSEPEKRLLKCLRPADFPEQNVTGSACISPPEPKTRDMSRKIGDPTLPPRFCLVCEERFYTKLSKKKFCSIECGNRSRKRKQRKTAGMRSYESHPFGGVSTPSSGS